MKTGSLQGGILTFHRNANPGSVMQAYCLSKFLNLPIVDFTYPNRLQAVRALCHLPGDKACLAWSESALWTTRRFHDEEEAVAFINTLDYVIIGSDEVWKYGNMKGAHLLCEYPNLYFGHRIKCRKIAYAASIGHKTRLTAREVEAIDQFDILSVRDQHTLNMIRSISPAVTERSMLVPDPTFAIEFVGPCHEKNEEGILLESKCGTDPTLLMRPLTPPQWFDAVACLKNAKTRRMHGLIACLLGNTPVELLADRPKVRELADEFNLGKGWPDQQELRAKIIQLRRKHEQFREHIASVLV